MTNASGRKQTILGSESFRCSASKQCLVSQQYLSHFASLALLSLSLSPSFLLSLPPFIHPLMPVALAVHSYLDY